MHHSPDSNAGLKSIDVISGLFRNGPRDVRDLCAASLFLSGNYADTVPVLIHAFGHASAATQATLLEMLRQYRNPELIPVLKAASVSNNMHTVSRALIQLYKMGQDTYVCGMLRKTGYEAFFNSYTPDNELCRVMQKCSSRKEFTTSLNDFQERLDSFDTGKMLVIRKCFARHSLPMPNFNPETYLQDRNPDIRLRAAEILYYRIGYPAGGFWKNYTMKDIKIRIL